MAHRRKARGNGAGSVYQVTVKGRRVWRAAETVAYYGEGQMKRIVGSGPTEKLAREALYRNKVRWQIKQGELPPEAQPLTPKHEALTLDVWFLTFLTRKERAASTMNEYRQRYRLHIAPYLGGKALRSRVCCTIR